MTLVEGEGWQLLLVRVMSCCLCWARSRHTNPPASCTAGSQAGPRRSTPRPSGARPGAGSCRSPWKSSAPNGPRPARTLVIGVDLAIMTLAVFSDGRPPAEDPKHYDTDRRTGQCPSNRWRRANDRRNKVHDSNLRRDGIHVPALPASTARSWWKTSPWRDAEEPQAGPRGLGRRARGDPPPADLQDPMEWRSSGDRRPLVPLTQDVLVLSGSKTKLPLRMRPFNSETCGLVLDPLLPHSTSPRW